MRVISGSAKGTALFSPRGGLTRPTSDFVKENLFNIIRENLAAANVLDLFAGTGALGIEALSRGAASGTFVDSSAKCTDTIRRNLEKTRLDSKGFVIKADALAMVKKLGEAGHKFNLIFLDPPYFEGLAEKTLKAILSHGILSEDGYAILEMSRQGNLSAMQGFRVFDKREYSGTRLVFLDLC